MLVASITDPQEIDQAVPLADLIELRLDAFDFVKKPPLPWILTLRKKEQGGLRDLSEKTRLEQIESLLEHQPDYCDLEADTDPAFIAHVARKFPHVKLIGSYHNFKETPPDLESVLQKMQNPHFALYKIAVKAQSTQDLLRLMLFTRRAKVPLAAMAMGEVGKPSRVLAPIMGSVLAYAGVQEDPSLHRYSLKTLHEVFHFRQLNRDTLIYALLGDPVEQSPGHLFHNPRFQHNAVYVKLRISKEEFPACFELIRKLPFGGLSITMPLKQIAYAHMDEVHSSVPAINTVTFRKGMAIGTNTDGAGALNAIEKHLSVKGKRLAILGAGGSAAAIAYEAKKRGAIVALYNRTLEKANRLALEVGCTAHALSDLHSYDILVNTTPPQNTALPTLLSSTPVMDIVYSPRETPLLAAAKKQGCPCIYGEEMFTEQALLQQREWTRSLDP